MKTQLSWLMRRVPTVSRSTFFLPAPWFVIWLVVAASTIQAAVVETWVHRYNSGILVSNSQDVALKVVRDGAGDIIVTGKSDGCEGDILTIKYSGVDGSLLWQQRYTAPDCWPGTSCCRACGLYPTAMAVDRIGNVIVAGTIGGGIGSYHYAAKYAATNGAVLWEKKRYDSGGYPTVVVDSDGNVVVAGGQYTAKHASADGALLWEQQRSPGTSANAVALDDSGNVVVTGNSYNGSNSDYYTAKYAADDGALVWERRYDGLADAWGFASALSVDGRGNVIVTGTLYNDSDFYRGDYYTAKYAAADGTLIWEKRYNGPADSSDWPSALAIDRSGNVFVTGTSYTTNNFYSAAYYTAKYAAEDGTLLWERRYNGPANTRNRASALSVDGIGNVVVTGTSHSESEPLAAKYYTAKYAAADGALLWEQRCDGYTSGCYDAFDYSPAMTVDSNDNVVLTGSLAANYYTAKYGATDGAVLWEQTYDGPPNKLDDYPSAVGIDAGGNVIVTGFSHNSSGDRDYYTAKYAAALGELLWAKRGPEGSALAVLVDGGGAVVVTGNSATIKYQADGRGVWTNHGGTALALDGSDDVVVMGQYSNGTNSNYYTAKYASADGALLWEKRHNGMSSRDDLARALTVDGGGNVIVTGISMVPGVNGLDYDYHTAKFAGTNGALLWEKRYDSGSDYPAAVAVDASGNVVMTGYSYPNLIGAQADFYTAKYAAADGALIWESRYNGAGEDRAYAVAVDPAGNVVVAGYSGNTDQADIYTVKYAAADGALLWERRHAGTYIGNHEAQVAMALDSVGNVVVTGTFRNTSGNNDYYTAKYAAADGALLWDKIYNGPANGEDIVRSPRSLALGPNGMVAVTGSSDGNFGGDTAYDYATVVYRENLPPAFVGFAASTLSVPEFEPEARVEVQRTGNLTTTVSVQYSAAPWGGAIIGQDYADVSGTLTFEPGETSDFIRVPILNDGEPEAMQGVQLTLSNPSGGAELGRTSAITYIIDNDRPTPAGPLIVTVGGPLYQDWSGPSLQWDQGYPGVNVRIDLDEATGGQIIADNEFVVGSHLNDQPAFTTTYTSNLRVNFLSAGFGQMKITYDLAFPIQLLDLMLLDVDEEDHVAIECRNRDGAPVDPRLLQLVMEGDLSRNFNAIGRPPSEAATPPVWNAAAGTLTAAVTWNENRSFTVLRPSVPVSSITLTFTGKRTGAHIYPLLWATPRRFEVTETRRTATGESHLRWTSLPGIPYRVMRSSNLADWVQVWAGDGAASPELTTQAIISSSELAPQFFRIQRW